MTNSFSCFLKLVLVFAGLVTGSILCAYVIEPTANYLGINEIFFNPNDMFYVFLMSSILTISLIFVCHYILFRLTEKRILFINFYKPIFGPLTSYISFILYPIIWLLLTYVLPKQCSNGLIGFLNHFVILPVLSISLISILFNISKCQRR